jgi:RNA polymerase sigma factor (sigma-70 family)
VAELTQDQLHCALRSEHGTMSLDTLEFTNTIRAPAGTDPAEALAASDLRALLRQSLAGLLDPRDAEIMTLLYALDGMGRRSPDEVGTQFGIEAYEISKIEARCLRKLQGQRQLAVRLHSYLES